MIEDEELAKREHAARERVAKQETKIPDEGVEVPAWLQEARDNPPPAPSQEELNKSQQRARWSETGPLRDRLPRFLRGANPKELYERIPNEHLKQASRKWQPEHGNMLLLGDTGTGKTTAAALIAKRVIEDGWRNGEGAWERAKGLRWYRAEELERVLKAHPLGRGEAKDYVHAIHAKFLVLDEVGWEKDHKLIASILAERYDSTYLTLVTSGLQVSELREVYGDAIFRRMATYKGRPTKIVKAFLKEAPAAPPTSRLPVGHPSNPHPHHEAASDR